MLEGVEATMSNVTVPVSVGELVDKITILRIKTKMIKNDPQLPPIGYDHPVRVCQATLLPPYGEYATCKAPR